MFHKQTLLACTSILPAFLVFGVTARAQEVTTPKYEVGLNYSWLHVNSANYDYQRTGNGGSGYFEYNVNKMVGLVADFGGYANTRKGIDDKLLSYMFGPRFNWRHSRLTPYVQFLFGGAYVWNGPTSTTQNAFATAAVPQRVQCKAPRCLQPEIQRQRPGSGLRPHGVACSAGDHDQPAHVVRAAIA